MAVLTGYDFQDDDLYRSVNGVTLNEAIIAAIHTANARRYSHALKERNSHTVIRRFGLEDGRPMTLEALGRDIGVTRERVRQIERTTLMAIHRTERSGEGRLKLYIKSDEENANDNG